MRATTIQRALTIATGAALGLLPQIAMAQAVPTSNKYRWDQISTFSDFVTVFWGWSSHIIFTLSVLTIITGGVIYIASEGNDTRIDAAKQVIKGAIISIVLVIISGTAINVLLEKPGAGIDPRSSDDSFKALTNTSSLFIGLAGGFTVVMLLFNGIKYITSSGDEEKIASARKGLTYSIVGLLICVTAFVVVRNVISIF